MTSIKKFNILRRNSVIVNTDPQRRCYNGAHAKSELRFTAWEILNLNVSENTLLDKLKFWIELNEYAVSQRGQSAHAEFKIMQVEDI